MIDVFTKVVLAGACLFTFAWVILAQRRTIRRLSDAYLRLTHFQRVLVALAVIVCTVYAQKPSTNDVEGVSGTNEVDIVNGGDTNGVGEAASSPLLMMLLLPLTSGEDAASPFSDDDCARGYRLEGVTTNEGYSYTMPADGMIRGTWHLTGAYEDVQKVTLDGFAFPLGSDLCDSLWVYTWGKVRPQLKNVSNEIAVVGAPMSAIPDLSCFWAAATSNDTYLLTWKNFATGRLQAPRSEGTAGTVNAQIELFRSGDFITRSNDVEKVYRRVDPDDWDGDGWRNDDDPDPYSQDEFYDDFCQELPDGANEDAYCWIEIRPRWHSYIEFYGDGPSNLDDPYLWAKAGETYSVQLLIGKTYTIVSSQPVDVVGQSSSSIEVDGSGTGEIEVVWPVRFSALEGNGSSFMMRVVPSGLGGSFTWMRHCCTLTGYGNQFWWAHERYCSCGGCYAHGFYSYEGYEKECTGGHCGCPYYDDDDPYESEEDDGPYAAGASVAFSKSVVIFEDTYTNMPGEVVARQSTRTTLTCIAHGGETGGTATFSIENGAKLVPCSGGSLPVTRFVPPLQKVEFEIVYEGRLPSGSEEDIIAKADFTERVTGTRHSTMDDRMTSVKVEISPEDLPPMNPSPHRHIMGISEKVNFSWLPEGADVEWRDGSGGGCIIDIIEGGNYFFCPWTSGAGRITASFGSVEYGIPFNVYEPSLDLRNATWDQELESRARVGESGWVGMLFDIYLLPNTVSFMGVYMEEIPVPASEAYDLAVNDYFALVPGVLPVTHDGVGGNDAGAGRWRQVHYRGGSNYWTSDKARMPHSCPPLPNVVPNMWAVGVMRWQIPIGWGDVHGNILGQFDPNPTEQVYEMETDGTLTIRKYNHHVKRDVEGRVWFDGSRVNAWWNDFLQGVPR